MNASNKAGTIVPQDTGLSPSTVANPVLAIRRGRGRLGGSLFLDLLIQRARHAGRRVQPLDGDLRSRTLATLYPAVDARDQPVQDGVSSPVSEELPDMKAWMLEQLDDMAESRVSRALDLGGGERVIPEFVRDLSLTSYCRDLGITLLSIYMLGPDVEDFRHVTELVRSGDMQAERTLLVMNEGVIRQGQTATGAFDTILDHPDMRALVEDGAASVFLKRLSCMPLVRDSGRGFYDVADGTPDAKGVRPRPTVQHMVKSWLQQNEAEHELAGTAGWLP